MQQLYRIQTVLLFSRMFGLHPQTHTLDTLLDTQPLDMPSTPLDTNFDTPRHPMTCVHIPSGLTASTQSLTLTSTQP